MQVVYLLVVVFSCCVIVLGGVNGVCVGDYKLITVENRTGCEQVPKNCLTSNGSVPCCTLANLLLVGVPSCSRVQLLSDEETLTAPQYYMNYTYDFVLQGNGSGQLTTVFCSKPTILTLRSCLNGTISRLQLQECEIILLNSSNVTFTGSYKTALCKQDRLSLEAEKLNAIVGDDDGDDCDVGYFYNTITGERQSTNSSNVCYYAKYKTTCVEKGYWFGNITPDAYAAYPCPFGSCNYSNCFCAGKNYFCEIFHGDYDALCYGNRGGRLCSQCKDNYSFTFNAIECAPDESCSLWHILTFIVLILIFWVGLVTVLLVVVSLDLHIGSGQLYCFIFYFSVLQFYVGGSFPSDFLFIVELLITGFIQLDPTIFGLIPVCIGQLSPPHLIYGALHYIHPIFLAVVIGLLVRCSIPLFHKSSRGINVICILLYLSFFSLTQTSLSFLVPISLGNHTYANIDPTVYYSDARHISFAVVALVVLVFLVTPFLGLLLFSPYLTRWFNLLRLKPILDEFQACYKDNCRSFAGFYLTWRVIIFLLSVVGNYFVNIYLLQIMGIVLLVVHAVFQPYKDWRLNILDTLFIADLILLSILHGSTANVVFDNVEPLKDVIVHLLVLLPLVYFFSICLWPLSKCMFSFCVQCRKKRKGRRLINEPSLDDDETSSDQARDQILFDQSTHSSDYHFSESTKPSEGEKKLPTYSSVRLSRPRSTH